MEKMITFFGQPAKVGCDEKCNKAWGINGRPKNKLSSDPDDYEYLSDDELGEAPFPGTSEGGQMRPTRNEEKGNKWCVRECERCAMSELGEYDKPLQLPDFSKRRRNINT